ncbi:MAG: response regulator [Planctomycetota bacterium]
MDQLSRQGTRVLLVDDEPHVTHVLGRRLRRHGYETLVARDGIEALEIGPGFRPDIILSDLQMPRLDGLSLAVELRRCTATAETPILLISGRGFLLDEERVRETNIVEVFEKPFSVDTVFAKITAIVSQQRSAGADAA